MDSKLPETFKRKIRERSLALFLEYVEFQTMHQVSSLWDGSRVTNHVSDASSKVPSSRLINSHPWGRKCKCPDLPAAAI